MYSHQELKIVVINLINDGVILYPSFAKDNGESRLDPSIFELMDSESKDFADLNWNQTLMVETFGDYCIPKRFPRTSLYETTASTAVHLCENKYGLLDVTQEIAREAFTMVTSFINKYGYGRFMGAIGMVCAYENYLALSHYESIPEREYLLGTRHRPWIDYLLEDELILSGQMNVTRIVVRDGKRHIELTETGYKHYMDIKAVLDEAGYLKQRAKLLRISQFSHLESYEETVNTLIRDAMQSRVDFLHYTNVQPGMKVLELGCGPGSLTFDAGLVERVGPDGSVVAIDPALGMLSRARRRLETYDYQNVTFIQGKAEQIPFEDGSFDAVVGSGFLHFTDIPVALREMCRVVKNGGIVSLVYPLSFPVQIPFISDWFEPLISMRVAQNQSQKDFLPTADVVPNIFHPLVQEMDVVNLSTKAYYTDPEKVVRFFIESVDVFEKSMAQLPWKARMEMIETLIERGQDICQRYTESDLIIDYPGQMIRGIVRK